MRTGFDSLVLEPLQVSWNRRIINSLNTFIPELMGFSQSNRRFGQEVINLDNQNPDKIDDML